MRFSERYGFKPEKLELQLDSMDSDLRSSLWSCLVMGILNTETQFNRERIREFGKSAYLNFFKWPVDRVPFEYYEVVETIKKWCFDCQWYDVYDFVEFALGYSSRNFTAGQHKSFESQVHTFLEREKSGYRLVAGKFAPITSQDEIESIKTAASDTDILGAAEHIRTAIGLYSSKTSPDYRNSIKESISAVESTVRVLSKNERASLSDALKILEKNYSLHPSLKEGFNKLYAYTSDEAGVRHAILDEENTTDRTDALFMLVVCSAFCNYLRAKIKALPPTG